MFRHLTAILAVTLLAALSLIATPTAATAAPVDITSAPALHWGFKGSWRAYVPAPAVSGGAAVVSVPGPGGYQTTWTFASGTYDADTATTILHYTGSAHWTKYFYPDNPAIAAVPSDYTGPLDINLLDVIVSDPTVTIGPDGASISAVASSRSLVDWKIKDYGRLDLAELDVSAMTPVVADGTATWSAIPAATSPGATAVFSGNYPAGIAIDPISLSYAGPGGAPDLTEDFTAPGTTPLNLAANTILSSNSDYAMFAIDPARRLGYYRARTTQPDGSSGGDWTYRAFDLDTLQPVGAAFTAPDGGNQGDLMLLDPDTGRLYLHLPAEPTIARWMRYDATAGTIVTGTLSAPIPVALTQGLGWDPVGHRAWEVTLTTPDGVDPSDSDHQVWTLFTYAYDQGADAWTRKAYTLPSFATGLNRSGYKRSGVVAADGSFVVPADLQAAAPGSGATTPATIPGAYRVTPDDATGTASATPVADLTIANATSALVNVSPGADGQVVISHPFKSAARPGWVRVLDAGVLSPEVPLGNFDGIGALTVDPEDGTIWMAGGASQRIKAVRDGQIVDDQFFDKRYPKGGFIWAGPNHTIYAQTSDGSPSAIGVTVPFGVGRFERVGLSPDVASGAPGNATVTLTADEPSEDVTLTAPTAGGTPVPTRQWQIKPRGGSRFKDVTGETGASLAVHAQRGMDGMQYRVVYENAAGRSVSDVATLSVRSAPSVTFDPLAVRVAPGQPATFQVLGSGTPEPTVSWQRRVDGFWQDIDPDADDNVSVQGSTLRIAATTAEQSGAQFRARLRNDVSTMYTKAATLTVAAAIVTPRTLVGVRLDWTGSDELQARAPNGQPSFFSAGVSDGSESTYAASAAGARIIQVAGDGTEAAATWATRGEHTASEGRKQLVRLTGGVGAIAADGTATVTWPGAFSVNFYGGLVPFTVKNLKLAIATDGSGTLKGDLSGYASSQANPGERTQVATVQGVTIATLASASVDPDGATTTITPAYAGVIVDLPVGSTQQDRTTLGWGAWPQSFVDFQVKTGLAPYWYSSGGIADARKAPHPFSLTVTGGADPTEPAPPAPGDDKPTPPAANTLPAPPKTTPTKPGWITARTTKQRVTRSTRTAPLATLSCPKRGATCTITAPKTVRITIGGKAYTATVLTVKSLKAGGSATLRVRLSAAALKRLKHRTATVKVKATITTGATKTARTISARLTA